MTIRYLYFCLVAALGFTLSACKTWDDRLVSSDDSLGKSLWEEIKSQNNLSTFADLLVKSGYDKVIASSKNYTVWAPNNDALKSLGTTILNDSVALRAFVGNHIALQSYVMPSTAQTPVMINLLNGKTLYFSKDTFGTAAITASNKYVGNGILHILGSSVAVLPSIWDYINTSSIYTQNSSVASLATLVFNPAKAIIDSISATTGQPIYRPNTGYEVVNAFTQNVYDLSQESKRYTYFLLENTAFTNETAKLNDYFKTGGADTTARLTAYNTTKDLVVEGDYALDQLPETLKSKFGVTLTIDKSAITQSIKLSNGTVHVVKSIGVNIAEKFQPIIVQGESYSSRMPVSLGSSVIAVRNRFNPLTNTTFNAISVIAHGNSGFWLNYRVPQTPSLKYKVYWVVVNDLYATNTATGETSTFAINQKLAMGSLSSATFAYPAAALPVKNYTEQLLGEYTVTNYGTLNMFLVANGTNAMTLDYIKLVPVL